MTRAALVGAVMTLAACDRPATQIVVRIDSDMRAGEELRGVQVTLRREGAAASAFDQTYDLTAGTLSLPGTVGVVPGDPDDPRRLEVEARAVLPGGEGFDTRATVSFQREQTLFLDLFLAARCRDPANRAGCGPDETCGPDGCEPIVRARLPAYATDVSRREASAVEDAGEAVDAPEPEDLTDVPEASDAADASDVEHTPDVVEDLPPPCGMPGELCCGGAPRCAPNTACAGGRCEPCGARAQPCCADGRCASGMTCANAVCAPCGADRQPCCAGATCSVGVCIAGTCGPCGARSQRCCVTGAPCAAENLCANRVCVACGAASQPCCAGNACRGRTTCSGADCVACGGSGQPCCGSSCDAGAACVSGRCAPCGAVGQPCCGASCAGGAVCRSARCAACGGNGEPCCAGDACDATGNPCVTAGCSAGTCRHATAPNGAPAGAANLRCCGGARVDIATNPSHCGGCNMGCGSGRCEAASTIACGGGGLTGRCICNGATAQCPVGAGGRRQVCRTQTPNNNRCAPENQSACGAGTTFVDVSFCPNYCRY